MARRLSVAALGGGPAGAPGAPGMVGFGQLDFGVGTGALPPAVGLGTDYGEVLVLLAPPRRGTVPAQTQQDLPGRGLIAAAATGTFPSRSDTDWRCVLAGGHR
jgi:hypothetical protein